VEIRDSILKTSRSNDFELLKEQKNGTLQNFQALSVHPLQQS
jgi:hypothetical protein